MKNIWVLSVKTSLPEVCESPRDLTLTTTAYDSFEKGRAALREVVKGYAFSKNSMFDGNGRMTFFEEALEGCLEADEDDSTYLSREVMQSFSDALCAAFAGEDVDFCPKCEEYTDSCYYRAECEEGALALMGDEEGPCNGIDPFIFTNIFSMVEEKDYYLYLDDLFGQDYSSELYIDLKKCELQ